MGARLLASWELGYRSYNTEIRKSYNIEIRQQIPEIPAHRKFVSAMCSKFVSVDCRAHFNAHKRPLKRPQTSKNRKYER